MNVIVHRNLNLTALASGIETPVIYRPVPIGSAGGVIGQVASLFSRVVHEHIIVRGAIAAGLPSYGPCITGSKRYSQISSYLTGSVGSGEEVLSPVKSQRPVRNRLADEFRNGAMLLIICSICAFTGSGLYKAS